MTTTANTALLRHALASNGFTYEKSGTIIAIGNTTLSKRIEEIIGQRDLAGLETEGFDRIYANIESDPAAVHAPCGLLETLFKRSSPKRFGNDV